MAQPPRVSTKFWKGEKNYQAGVKIGLEKISPLRTRVMTGLQTVCDKKWYVILIPW